LSESKIKNGKLQKPSLLHIIASSLFLWFDIESNFEFFFLGEKSTIYWYARETYIAFWFLCFICLSSSVVADGARKFSTFKSVVKSELLLHSVAFNPRIRSFLSSCSRDRSAGRYKLIQVRDKISDERLIIIRVHNCRLWNGSLGLSSEFLGVCGCSRWVWYYALLTDKKGDEMIWRNETRSHE